MFILLHRILLLLCVKSDRQTEGFSQRLSVALAFKCLICAEHLASVTQVTQYCRVLYVFVCLPADESKTLEWYL